MSSQWFLRESQPLLSTQLRLPSCGINFISTFVLALRREASWNTSKNWGFTSDVSVIIRFSGNCNCCTGLLTDINIIVDWPLTTPGFTSHSLHSSVNSVSERLGCNTSSKSLRALAIMPLEPRFGEAIQDWSVRSKYLCDGQPNDRTGFSNAKYGLKRDTL